MSVHPLNRPEYIACSAVYVDTGRDEGRRSYVYPETGLMFCGRRHPDCFCNLEAWARRLWFWERWRIFGFWGGGWELRFRRQGFMTSKGRFVDREEAGRIAFEQGQTDELHESLTSEGIY